MMIERLKNVKRLKNKLCGLHARFSDESGATAVEIALIAPVLLMMILLMLETGTMQLTEYVLQAGVQSAAREVRTGQARSSTLTAADFRQKVCKLVGVMVDCSKITVHLEPATSFTALRASIPDAINIGPSQTIPGAIDNAKYDSGKGGTPVALIATYDWKFAVPYFMKPLGNVSGNNARRIYGMAIFKNEPFK